MQNILFKTYSARISSRLYNEALKSDFKQRHSSCITYRGKILAAGHNKPTKSHPLMAQFSDNENRIFLHSEMDCIIKVIRKYGIDILKDCSIYNLRLLHNDKVGLSKPCPICQKAIDHFEIKQVFWT